jgi:hypothetical protein
VGLNSLADKVEPVFKTKGDSTGFDCLSFEANGHESVIEVTTD